jgi:uncharacterized protein
MADIELLVGYIRQVRQTVYQAVGDLCEVVASIQTNGTLLSEKIIRKLAEEGIIVGVSLDGGSAKLNRLRVNHAGQSMWASTAKGLELLARHPKVNGGILCVIDVENDPVEVFDSLLIYKPPAVKFLLPHGNHTSPPPGLPSISTPYGDWLVKLFDRWFDDPHQSVDINFFSEIIRLLCGDSSRTEAVGLSPFVAVVIETDGSIEQVDSLKTTFAGAPEIGLNVHEHDFDQALKHPGIVARQMGLQALAPECQVCHLKSVCGGGNYVHRYREANGG